MGSYTETYCYDPWATSGHGPPGRTRGWTRWYSYAEAVADRRHRDRQPADRHQPARRPAAGPFTGTYRHDAPQQHDADAAPGGADLGQRRPFAVHRPQPRRGGTPQTAYYAYDGGGERVCKATDWQVTVASRPA